MPARRKAAAVALGLAAPALAALSAAPAAAHGSMGDPVSRVAQCYAQGPQSPRSDACRAAVAAGGAQALYDWNGIRIGDANGRHQELIPDGRLCSAGNEEFKGLDLARADWPATAVDSGPYTFGYRVTAPHEGTFKVYLTKAGYDPARPLAWSDLDLAHPVATAVDPVATGGFSTFSGTLPSVRAGSCCTRCGSARTARRRSTPARTSRSREGARERGRVRGRKRERVRGRVQARVRGRATVPRRPPPRPPRSRSGTGPTGRRSSTTGTATTTRPRRRTRRPPARPPPTVVRGTPRAPPRTRRGRPTSVPVRASVSRGPAGTAAPRISRWAARPSWRWARPCCSRRCAGGRRPPGGTAAESAHDTDSGA